MTGDAQAEHGRRRPMRDVALFPRNEIAHDEEGSRMRWKSGFTGLTRALAVVGVGGMLAASVATAQTSTGSMRGRVYGENRTPIAEVQIELTNPASGVTRGAISNAGGFYNIAAVPPGTYTVRARRIGYTPVERTVRLQIGEVTNLDLDLSPAAQQLSTVTVAATATTADARTSEVATNVTTEQIENLPQGNRNFLEFAALAPGVQTRGASISAGGTSTGNTNLFIDGASYKSDVLPGGVAGQDPSLSRVTGAGRVVGNPFPQSAVQEFRVLTQNYKAEYQKASGAVITAATKTGSNQTHGDLFYYSQNENWIARNAFQDSAGLDVPNFGRQQFGGSIGGPIIRDKAHYFASYEGNFQNTDDRVIFRIPTGVTVPAALTEGQGTFDKPLRSHLFFGKATYQVNDRQDLMLTVNVRDERDERDFGGNNAVERRTVVDNDVNTVVLRHTFAGQPYTNEAQVSFQQFQWNSSPENPDLATQTYFLGGQEINRGGNSSFQDFKQLRTSLRDDLTWVASSHVIKGGANLDFLTYDVNKLLDEVPHFYYDINRPQGLSVPYEGVLQIGDPALKTNNKQVGVYVQDDWSATDRLTLNLGVRWDYETNWLNNDYRTPSRYADSVRKFLTVHPYFNADDYITDGNARKNFYGAFQPRLGFSYDLQGNNRTVVFGGGGLFYDRINYNVLLDEKYKVQRPRYSFRFVPQGTTPGTGEIVFDPSYLEPGVLAGLAASGNAGNPEVFLIKNDQKPPYSLQGSFGIRHSFGMFNASVTGTMVNGYNYFKWVWGNRDPLTSNLFFGSNGIGAILISTDEARTWYKAGLFQLSKPFVGDARWGGDLSYTLAKQEVSDFQDVDDPFALDFIPDFALGEGYNANNKVLAFKRRPGRFDERHRIVLNLLTRIPFDVRLSTITTLGSGQPYSLSTGCTSPTPGAPDPGRIDCRTQPIPATFIPFFLAQPAGVELRSERPEGKWFGPFGKWGYRDVDVRLQKDIVVGTQTLGISLDVQNVFNFVNYNFGNNFVYNLNDTTPRRPGGEFDTYDSRRFQLGAKYSF
jgi:hypothetical protein